MMCRSPYGERGLKLLVVTNQRQHDVSLSLRRAWIEIEYITRLPKHVARRSPYGERGLKLEVVVGMHFRLLSLSLRRAWIEIITPNPFANAILSLSLRRAWIEI